VLFRFPGLNHARSTGTPVVYRHGVSPMPEPGDLIEAFSPQPGRCFRMVYSVQLQADHCRRPPAWRASGPIERAPGGTSRRAADVRRKSPATGFGGLLSGRVGVSPCGTTTTGAPRSRPGRSPPATYWSWLGLLLSSAELAPAVTDATVGHDRWHHFRRLPPGSLGVRLIERVDVASTK